MFDINSLKQNLLLLSLFFYPLVFLNHILYLVPQFLILLIIFFQKIYPKRYLSLASIFCVISCFIAVFVEFNSNVVLYDMISKLVVNTVTIIMIGSNIFIIDDRIRKKIIYILFFWFVLVLFCYKSSGTSDLMSLYYIMQSGDVNSSDLYNAAEPISTVFLTKNISGMFVVSIFAFYIYISEKNNKDISLFEILLFFIVISSFLSRQAILSYIILLAIYKLRSSNKYLKGLFLIVGLSFILVFVSKFIDINNSNDGASERIYLWKYFFINVDQFFYFGLGFDGLNKFVQRISEVGNFHMFFMNQIGLYGVFHFLFFNLFLFIIYLNQKGFSKNYLLLGYILNVLFQTYGYEYGNLFLFMAMLMVVKHNNDKLDHENSRV